MSQRWTVPGSQRVLPASTRVLGDADPNAESLVTLIVRSRRSQTPPPGAMSREAFAREYGADDADLQKVEEFARTHGLSVVERSVGRRSVVLRGTVAQMSAAFGVHLKRCQTGGVTFRGREGSLSVPADLEGIVVAVLGLDDRPQASASRAHRRTAANVVHAGAGRCRSTTFRPALPEPASASPSSNSAAASLKPITIRICRR